jgi:CheY-like chemotaxis protein
VNKVKEGKRNVEKNGNRTVMVVEDFRDARLMMKEALETKGYRVVEAADGWEAVGLATQVRPHLILMDLHLPVLDGVEAACLLREHGEFGDVPMIAITANDSADSRADAADCGFDEYVTKPIDFDHLEPLIERLLQDK